MRSYDAQEDWAYGDYSGGQNPLKVSLCRPSGLATQILLACALHVAPALSSLRRARRPPLRGKRGAKNFMDQVKAKGFGDLVLPIDDSEVCYTHQTPLHVPFL